jgi:hypothetical protein
VHLQHLLVVLEAVALAVYIQHYQYQEQPIQAVAEGELEATMLLAQAALAL